MTIRQTVTVEGQTYTVVDDRTLDLQAFIVGQALDELTNRPPLEPLRLSAQLQGMDPVVAARERRFALTAGQGGAFAVAGVPELAFPNLAVTPFTVEVVLTGDSYLETSLTVPVPAGSSFPLPTVIARLRRPAVRLRGRTTTAGAPPAPINGAVVELVAPAGLFGFRAPLAFVHDVITAVAPVTLTAFAPDLTLLEDVPAGAQRLELRRRDGLAVDGVIRLGAGPEREYATVESLVGPADLTLQGAVTLRAPLAHAHTRAETPPPRRATVGAIGAGTPLTRRAFPGDQAVFVNDATLFLADATFVIDDAVVARREFRVASPLADATDADGYYRIGPVGRTPTVTMRVTPPASPAEPDVVLPLDYNEPDNVFNMRV